MAIAMLTGDDDEDAFALEIKHLIDCGVDGPKWGMIYAEGLLALRSVNIQEQMVGIMVRRKQKRIGNSGREGSNQEDEDEDGESERKEHEKKEKKEVKRYAEEKGVQMKSATNCLYFV
ncbi:hypothetical protein F5890DRAFT_1557443 [Lentinula detonsa]|uniref:Uncharacterized protein n=1 Tax=Lentinula detonsa TaxID=2804962 RepID=A0AA38PSZ8_9AGAR|nr:hypothetical protein F5890DRAFT_1557443 [Lentinula detonsa]